MTSPGGNVITVVVTSKDQTGPGFAAANQNIQKTTKSAAGLGQEMDRTETKAKGLGGVLRDIGTVAGGVLLAGGLQAGARKALEFGKATVKAATDLGESTNAVSKVFDEQTDVVLKWGEQNANSFGLSRRAFNQAITPLGAMLKNTGMSMQEVSTHTIDLTKRAADVASVFNVDVSEAMMAFQAAIRGESEPIRRFGVSLSEAAIAERALADSGKAAAAELTAQDKAAARLALIYEQTADSAGDFADTSDGLANAQRIATAQMEDAQAKIGSAFLPVMAKAAVVTGKAAEAFGNMSGPTQMATAVVGALGVATIILAPKVMAAKQAIDAMAASESRLTRGMGRMSVAVAKAGAIFAGVSLGIGLAANAFLKDLNPQVDAAVKGLTEWDRKSKLAGESARLFSDDTYLLEQSLRKLGANGFGEAMEKTADFLGGIVGIEGPMDEARKTAEAFDQALAQMVRDGNALKAAQIVEEMAKRSNLSLEQVKKVLTTYNAALEVSGAKTAEVATEIEAETVDIVEAWETAYEDFIDIEGAYESALDELVGKQKLTTKDIIRELEEQVRAQEQWADNMKRLSVRVPKEMLEELSQIGPKGAGLVKQLASMTDKEMARVIAAWEKGGKLSGDAFADEINAARAKVILPAARRVAEQAAALFASIFGGRVESAVSNTSIGGQRSFATGGISGAATGGPRGNWTMVGEGGRELVRLPFGSSVQSNPDTERMLSGSGPSEIRVVLDIRTGVDDLDTYLKKRVFILGGGDVQVAYGT